MTHEQSDLCGASCLRIPLLSLMEAVRRWQKRLPAERFRKVDESVCATSRAHRKMSRESIATENAKFGGSQA